MGSNAKENAFMRFILPVSASMLPKLDTLTSNGHVRGTPMQSARRPRHKACGRSFDPLSHACPSQTLLFWLAARPYLLLLLMASRHSGNVVFCGCVAPVTIASSGSALPCESFQPQRAFFTIFRANLLSSTTATDNTVASIRIVVSYCSSIQHFALCRGHC